MSNICLIFLNFFILHTASVGTLHTPFTATATDTTTTNDKLPIVTPVVKEEQPGTPEELTTTSDPMTPTMGTQQTITAAVTPPTVKPTPPRIKHRMDWWYRVWLMRHKYRHHVGHHHG